MLEELVAQPHCIYVYGCNKICLNYVKKLFIWPSMKNALFSLPKNIKNMIYGLVKK